MQKNKNSNLSYPDPVASANFYCAGSIDEVISHAVWPAWRQYQIDFPDHHAYLWMMRYATRGEHLKIRLHGPENVAEQFRPLLQAESQQVLDTLPKDQETLPTQKKQVEGPPIDREDYLKEPQPDRNLVWTSYQRSFVCFGGQPFLDQDQYVALFTRCLAAGSELIFDTLKHEKRFNNPMRRTLLLKGLIAGLQSLDLPLDEWSQYLVYHRDWLIRFKIRALPEAQNRANQLLERLNDRAQGNPESLQKIREMLTSPSDPSLDFWHKRIRDLRSYVRPFTKQPGYRLEPFAPDPTFSPIFKVFHGLSNQLGLTMLDESLTHHLLLRAACREFRESPTGVQLVPPAES